MSLLSNKIQKAIATQGAAYFMRHAITLAEQGRGNTAPNPCVGAVLVQDGNIVARGWHAFYGGPHAEINCLEDAGKKGVDPARCALFVTLEPCNHFGKTPPCATAVLAAKIPVVYVGCEDKNSKAAGGVKTLLQNGVTVVTGVEENLCRELIADFSLWQQKKRSYVTLKLAATLDGKIATRTGHSQWISSQESRAEVHALRARSQAVLVGGNTLRVDNPRLSARENGKETIKQPLAVVVTTRLPQPAADLHLLQTRAEQTVFWTTAEAASSPLAVSLKNMGCEVLGLPEDPDGSLQLDKGMELLYKNHKVWHVLCEGGGKLALSLFQKKLVDEFLLYLAPKVLADEKAVNLFSGMHPETIDQALGLEAVNMRHSGADIALTLRPETKEL